MGVRRGRGRTRLRDVLENADSTVDVLRAVISGLVQEFQDGFTIEFIRVGPGTPMEFLTGRIDRCPIAARVVPEEEEDVEDGDE